jgi:hypothetical protein
MAAALTRSVVEYRLPVASMVTVVIGGGLAEGVCPFAVCRGSSGRRFGVNRGVRTVTSLRRSLRSTGFSRHSQR